MYKIEVLQFNLILFPGASCLYQYFDTFVLTLSMIGQLFLNAIHLFFYILNIFTNNFTYIISSDILKSSKVSNTQEGEKPGSKQLDTSCRGLCNLIALASGI